MRRLLTLLIMLVVPLQFAWAATVGVYGHAGQDVAAAGFHAHGHDHGHDGHHDDAHQDRDVPDDSANPDHADDGHHGHTHPVFASLLAADLALTDDVSGGPILQSPSQFLSRTPPLLDRPPLSRA